MIPLWQPSRRKQGPLGAGILCLLEVPVKQSVRELKTPGDKTQIAFKIATQGLLGYDCL